MYVYNLANASPPSNSGRRFSLNPHAIKIQSNSKFLVMATLRSPAKS